MSNITVGIVANGTTQLTGTLINPLSFHNQISACTATNSGITLPATPLISQSYKFRNDAVAGVNLIIFPPVGGTINGSASFALNVGGECEIIFSSLLTAFVFNLCQANPSVSGLIADQAGVSPLALTSNSAGLNQIAIQSVGALVINIPTAVNNKGLSYQFQNMGTQTQTITITPVAGTLYGSIIDAVTAGCTSLTCLNKANIGFTAVASTGSTVTLISDGANWKCSAWGTIAAAFA